MHSTEINLLAEALSKAQAEISGAHKFYVYAHTNKKGDVLYVGKGSGDRHLKIGNRSIQWKKYFKLKKFYTVFLDTNLLEGEAYQKEKEWISFYKNINQCKLNVANGGSGIDVDKRWWGPAISKAAKGRVSPFGKESKSFKDCIDPKQLDYFYNELKLSTTEIAKNFGVSYATICSRLKMFGMSARRSGWDPRPIKCIDDGNIFPSVKAAAKFYGVFSNNICKVLKGKYKSTGNKVFIYV